MSDVDEKRAAYEAALREWGNGLLVRWDLNATLDALLAAVRADERERCAAIADDENECRECDTSEDIAARIRARKGRT